jgi:DUF1009 family protein
MQKVGLIAGSGAFPLLFAEEVRRLGYSVVAVAHEGETSPALSEKVDRIFWIRVGQLGRLISLLKREGVTQAVMAGAIKKTRLFSDVRPDLRSIKLLARLAAGKDDFILRAVAGELEREGIRVEGATHFVPSLLAERGTLGRRSPTRRELEDLEFGLQVMREIGRADVGQCVVVRNKTVLAVEAIEGTDETIRRGGRFARGAVVVKASKPQQDLRFDLPAVGPRTIEAMREVEASCLGLEAGKTIILERSLTLSAADAAKVAVVGLNLG